MSKKLYSATEIAKMRLPGFPISRDNVRARAEREGWYCEERKGLGGGRRVYEIPAHYLGEEKKEEVSNAEITDNKQRFTKKMYSCREISEMNLPGMPKSKPAILAKARRECWPSEKRTVFGGMSEVYEIPAHYLDGTEAEQPRRPQATAKPAVARAVAGGQQANLALLQQVDTILEEVLQEKEVKLLPQRRGTVLAFLYDCVTKGVDLERLKAALQVLVA